MGPCYTLYNLPRLNSIVFLHLVQFVSVMTFGMRFKTIAGSLGFWWILYHLVTTPDVDQIPVVSAKRSKMNSSRSNR